MLSRQRSDVVRCRWSHPGEFGGLVRYEAITIRTNCIRNRRFEQFLSASVGAGCKLSGNE